MSIPHTFNPLGSSAADGYVTSGLKLFVDCLATTDPVLYDVVQNREVPSNYSIVKSEDGGLRILQQYNIVPWPEWIERVSTPTLEIVLSYHDASAYGLISTPFMGDTTTRKKWTSVYTRHFAARNEEPENRAAHFYALGEKMQVSFVAANTIYSFGEKLETTTKDTTWAAGINPALISTNWRTEPTKLYAWTVYAIRYYDRELTPQEIAKNYETDKKRYHLQ